MEKLLWIVLLEFWMAVALCGAQEIRSVVVTGMWGGLGKPSKSEITLRSSSSGFEGDGLRVGFQAIQRLLSATREPPIVHPSAKNLGIDKAWLLAHVETAGKNASGLWFDNGTPTQKQFFTAKFTDLSTLQARLDRVYAGSHTDDYPGMKVVIEFTDGTAVIAKSHSQNPLMLPWCVGKNSQCKETFNADISEALFSILPRDFTNSERLHDGDSFGDLAPQMGLYMSGDLEREWNRIGVQDKDPATLSKLRQHFTVKYADINTYNDLAFNEVPNEGKKVDENLQVILWRPGFPPNFTIEAHLLREDGVTQGVDEVFLVANRYADTVLDVPWLGSFLRAHPQERAIVNYVHGISMTDKAMRIFAKDMRVTGHESLIERVRASQREDTLLETGSGDWWIVLPDHSMILWRWASLRPILKWPANSFPAKECTDYQEVSGGCDGTLIRPDGERAE